MGRRIIASSFGVALAVSIVACRGADEMEVPATSSTASSSGTGGSTGNGGNAATGTGGSIGTGGSGLGGSSGTGGSAGTTTSASTSTTSSSSSSTGGSGGTTGAGGMGTGGTGAGGSAPCGPSMPAEIVQSGQGTILLRGMVVTPDQAFQGEVLINGDTISCVDVTCAAAATATIVDTHGLIFPGLIDTHNHILFDIFDETDWSPMASYTNHNQWTNEARYGAMVDAKQYLNGEGTSPVDYGCEMNKYGELKGLVAGTTSIVGAANPANRACYGSLARTIDQTPNGLGADKIQVATLFPSTSTADGVCTNFSSGKTDAYVIHIGEGVDNTALKEFDTLNTVTTTDGCLYSPKTTIVHGTALGATQLDVMAQHQMSLVWSPRSNVFLYGAGTDLTKTANIPLAISKGINVALAPDWSIGGSQNLLDELRFADHVDNTIWGNQLTPQVLVSMVTKNAAKALGLDAVLGSIAVGKKADLMVIGGDTCAPYDALLAATPASVRLVLVGGVVLYGDAALQSLGPKSPGCEALDVCSTSKFACVATQGGTTTNKLGQTFAEIQTTLSSALASYDALNLTAWKFSPITPVVRCP